MHAATRRKPCDTNGTHPLHHRHPHRREWTYGGAPKPPPDRRSGLPDARLSSSAIGCRQLRRRGNCRPAWNLFPRARGSPGHNSRYPMSGSGEIHSRHCWRLMLVVSLSRSISDVAVAGQIRAILSSLVLATRCPSRLNAQVTYGVAGERGADGLAGVGVPHPHRAVFAAREDALPVGADRWPHRRTVGSGGSSASLPATGSYASRDTAEVTPVTRVALTGAMRRFFKAIAHAISNPRVLHHEAEWS